MSSRALQDSRPKKAMILSGVQEFSWVTRKCISSAKKFQIWSIFLYILLVNFRKSFHEAYFYLISSKLAEYQSDVIFKRSEVPNLVTFCKHLAPAAISDMSWESWPFQQAQSLLGLDVYNLQNDYFSYLFCSRNQKIASITSFVLMRPGLCRIKLERTEKRF